MSHRALLLALALLLGACDLPLAFAQPAKPLGTLIFTPQERAELERARQDLAIVRPNAAPAPPPVTAVTVDGMMRRSDGTQSTVSTWLNGTNAASNAASRLVGQRPDGVALRADSAGSGGLRTLKPGQTLLPDGTIRDAFDNPDARLAALRSKTPVVIREVTETTRIETVAPPKLKQGKVKRTRAAKVPKTAKQSGAKAPTKKPSVK